MKLSKYLGAAQGVLGGIIWIMLFFSLSLPQSLAREGLGGESVGLHL